MHVAQHEIQQERLALAEGPSHRHNHHIEILNVILQQNLLQSCSVQLKAMLILVGQYDLDGPGLFFLYHSLQTASLLSIRASPGIQRGLNDYTSDKRRVLWRREESKNHTLRSANITEMENLTKECETHYRVIIIQGCRKKKHFTFSSNISSSGEGVRLAALAEFEPELLRSNSSSSSSDVAKGGPCLRRKMGTSSTPLKPVEHRDK